jgi:hypothetical protein
MTGRHALIWLLCGTLLWPGRVAATQSDACDGWDPFTQELESELADRYPQQRFTAAVADLDRGCEFALAPGRAQSTASVIKVTIMAATLLRAQDEGRDLSAWERASIEPMISRSDDPAASALWTSLGGASGIQATLDRFGLSDTVPVSPKWGASLTTAADQIELLRQVLVGGGPLDEPGRAEAREFMEQVIPSQRWGVTAGLPDDWAATWSVPMKNGFFDSVGWDWRINTVGHVEPPQRQGYLLAVLSDGWSAEAPGIVGVEIVALAINRRLNRTTVPGHPFIDVGERAHYDQALGAYWAAGVIHGTTPAFFRPHEAMTRAQLAAVLHRVAGSPSTAGTPFSDVGADSPFAESIAWLAEQAITTGITDTRFGPDQPVTRGQVAAMLHRRAGSPQPSTDSPFVDVPAGAAHHDAIAWMAETGITLGVAPGWFAPADPVSRGQVVSLLARADNLAEPDSLAGR